jgi:hypothetical protein
MNAQKTQREGNMFLTSYTSSITIIWSNLSADIVVQRRGYREEVEDVEELIEERKLEEERKDVKPKEETNNRST